MKQWRYYVAYGSNLNLEQMAKRCPDAEFVGTGMLEEYELQFRGKAGGAYATIEQKTGKQVPILLWKISGRDEKRLDLYEGYPSFYGKQTVEVEIDGTAYTAMLYEMQPGMEYNSPSPQYYHTIQEGYQTLGLPLPALEEAFLFSVKQSQKETSYEIEPQW